MSKLNVNYIFLENGLHYYKEAKVIEELIKQYISMYVCL